MRLALACLLVLSAAACVPWLQETPPERTAERAAFCYRTIGGIDCYDRPRAEDGSGLVGVSLPAPPPRDR